MHLKYALDQLKENMLFANTEMLSPKQNSRNNEKQQSCWSISLDVLVGFWGGGVEGIPHSAEDPEIYWIFWRVELKEIFWRVALVFRIRMAFTHPHQFKHLQNNSGHILLFNRI